MNGETHTSGLHIWTATPEDLPALARLLESIDAQTISSEVILKRLKAVEGVETTLLARLDGQIVGMVCLRVIPTLAEETSQAEISELYTVKKEHRAGEVECGLLRQAEKLSWQGGAQRLTLITGLKNQAAQSFYKSLGYQDHALLMRKRLKAEESISQQE